MHKDDLKKQEKLNQELDTLKNICYDYKKNKSFNIQLILSAISGIVLYCQQYVLKNNIDIGFNILFIKYIGIVCIASVILGWVSYFLEFHTTNFKVFKIGKIIIWILELLLVIGFIFLLIKG